MIRLDEQLVAAYTVECAACHECPVARCQRTALHGTARLTGAMLPGVGLVPALVLAYAHTNAPLAMSPTVLGMANLLHHSAAVRV